MEREEMITRLKEVYDQAESLFNDEKGTEAAELLKQEIPAIDSVAEIPGAIIPWLDATSLLANILLLLSRPDEALEYGRSVYEAAILYLPDTLEQIYATELYASCLYGVGKIDEAREYYNEAISRLQGELSEGQALLKNMKLSLADLNEE